MATYEQTPESELQASREKRENVKKFLDETLDLLLEWRSDTPSLFHTKESNYENVATQLCALELTLARLDREIAELEVEIAAGADVQDPKPEVDFGNEDWTFEHNQQ